MTEPVSPSVAEVIAEALRPNLIRRGVDLPGIVVLTLAEAADDALLAAGLTLDGESAAEVKRQRDEAVRLLEVGQRHDDEEWWRQCDALLRSVGGDDG